MSVTLFGWTIQWFGGVWRIRVCDYPDWGYSWMDFGPLRLWRAS